MSGQALVLVEDDPGDTLLVQEMLLEAAPDATVRCFRTLTAAIAEWPAEVDCVLLDLGLPDVMGLDAVRKLLDHAPDVPVVVLTGRIDDRTGPEALAAGAQDYLVKGQVDGPGLERSVRYAVERGRALVDRRDLAAASARMQENARLQRGLLPSPLVDTDAVEIALFYRPGSERVLLGGDFYDVVQTPTGVHLLIGDVSGHGPDEAALGVALRIAWRSLVLSGQPAADVLRGVEQMLVAERNDDDAFATVSMVSLSPDLTRAEVVRCGHPAPLLVRGGSVSELAGAHLPILSMVGDRGFEPMSVGLSGDWGILLYTDGLVEGCRTPGAKERLGIEAVTEHLESLLRDGVARDDIARFLVAEAERCQGGPLTDDVAVLLVGSKGWWC